MRQKIVCILLCSMLTGCAVSGYDPWRAESEDIVWNDPTYEFDFSWVLVGDVEIAPLQVFSNAEQMWLRFANTDLIASFYVLRDAVLVPVQSRRQGFYHVIHGRDEILLIQQADQRLWAYKAAARPALWRYLHTELARLQGK